MPYWLRTKARDATEVLTRAREGAVGHGGASQAHHEMLAAGKPMVPSGVLKEGPTRSVMKLNIIQNFKSANA